MNLSNISENDMIKNYKELCQLLELEETTNKSKIRQLKWLSGYIDFEQDGHKFIIKKINRDKKIIPISDNRGKTNNQNGAYGKYIKLLILNMLSKNESDNKRNSIIIGKNMMLVCLNMINENYKYGNYNRKAMAKYLGIDIETVHEFFDTNTKKLKHAVETTMNNLMYNNRLIHYATVRMIGTNYEHREATDEEIEFIVNCETEVLKEMGISEMTHIYIANRLDEFYSKVNKRLNENSILYSYFAYKIIFAKEVYERNEQLQYKLEMETENYNKRELNSKVYEKLNKSVISRHNKTKNEVSNQFNDNDPDLEWLNKNKKYKAVLYKDEFIENNKKLIDVCIDSDYDDICELIGQAIEQSYDYEHIHKMTMEEIIDNFL